MSLPFWRGGYARVVFVGGVRFGKCMTSPTRLPASAQRRAACHPQHRPNERHVSLDINLYEEEEANLASPARYMVNNPWTLDVRQDDAGGGGRRRKPAAVRARQGHAN